MGTGPFYRRASCPDSGKDETKASPILEVAIDADPEAIRDDLNRAAKISGCPMLDRDLYKPQLLDLHRLDDARF